MTKAADAIKYKGEDAVHVMNKMNLHMSGIVKDLNEIDGLVEII